MERKAVESRIYFCEADENNQINRWGMNCDDNLHFSIIHTFYQGQSYYRINLLSAQKNNGLVDMAVIPEPADEWKPNSVLPDKVIDSIQKFVEERDIALDDIADPEDIKTAESVLPEISSSSHSSWEIELEDCWNIQIEYFDEIPEFDKGHFSISLYCPIHQEIMNIDHIIGLQFMDNINVFQDYSIDKDGDTFYPPEEILEKAAMLINAYHLEFAKIKEKADERVHLPEYIPEDIDEERC